MIGRLQLPQYTAAALTAANPVLLDGEIVYESDTRRHKLGDGVTAWIALPYAMDAEEVPAVTWKVQDGMLCVKPATDLKNSILKRGFVGILHYKNARKRVRKDPTTGKAKVRPQNQGFKLVQDSFAREELWWTTIRINPIPFDVTKTDAAGWMPIIAVENLVKRWIERFPDPTFAGGGKFDLHRGINLGDRNIGPNSLGKVKMQASFYAGVVLFVGNTKYRVEGPRAYFKVVARNYDSTYSIMHI